MFGHRSGSVSTNDNAASAHLAWGVEWTPADAKHRRIPPKLLFPGNRRSSGAHRRARHIGQHASASALRSFLAGSRGLVAARP
jgi:hypothetical protein